MDPGVAGGSPQEQPKHQAEHQDGGRQGPWGRVVAVARVMVVMDLSCSLTRVGPETMAQVVRRPEEREKVAWTSTWRPGQGWPHQRPVPGQEDRGEPPVVGGEVTQEEQGDEGHPGVEGRGEVGLA